MTYDVFLSADGASPDELHSATQVFRRVLNDTLGDEAEASRCFLAHSRLERHGGMALTPEDGRDAAAWVAAFFKATAAARESLQRAPVGFTVRIAPI